jgi:hypothetical protein
VTCWWSSAEWIDDFGSKHPAELIPAKGSEANLREDIGEVLGIVSQEYEVVDNRDAFRFLDALIGSELHFETAGSLWGGRRVWVPARLPEYVEFGGDVSATYIYVANSHLTAAHADPDQVRQYVGGCTPPSRARCLRTADVSPAPYRQQPREQVGGVQRDRRAPRLFEAAGYQKLRPLGRRFSLQRGRSGWLRPLDNGWLVPIAIAW